MDLKGLDKTQRKRTSLPGLEHCGRVLSAKGPYHSPPIEMNASHFCDQQIREEGASRLKSLEIESKLGNQVVTGGFALGD